MRLGEQLYTAELILRPVVMRCLAWSSVVLIFTVFEGLLVPPIRSLLIWSSVLSMMFCSMMFCSISCGVIVVGILAKTSFANLLV